MRYSKNYNRDYDFFHNNREVFNFCGTLEPNYVPIFGGTVDAKMAFYQIQTFGKRMFPVRPNKSTLVQTTEPELLKEILLCQAGINFQIKQWAECRAEGTLPLAEFSKREYKIRYPDKEEPKIKTLTWVKGEPSYFDDIETEFSLPKWVIDAVEAQKHRFYKQVV